jgi:hypothetical protein
MAFWNNATLEPKRAHRFLLQFDLPGGITTQIYARRVSKPAFDVGQSEHKFLGSTYYYPGAVTWSDVSCTLVDSATPDFDSLVMLMLRNAGYVDPNDVSTTGNVDDAGTLSKATAAAALGGVLIKELDGDGDILGHWILNNPWVRSVSFGDLDYASEELMTVDLTLRYDWAEYKTGAPTGRG